LAPFYPGRAARMILRGSRAVDLACGAKLSWCAERLASRYSPRGQKRFSRHYSTVLPNVRVGPESPLKNSKFASAVSKGLRCAGKERAYSSSAGRADPAARALMRDGEVVPLPTRAFDLLPGASRKMGTPVKPR